MATERRLHLFLSMCCCSFVFFFFSCGTKEFIFRVLKLAQNNVFCMFFLGTKIDSFSKITDVRLTAPNRFFSTIFGMTQIKSMHKKINKTAR